ncbi:MAG TPA: hypothetical protein VI365_06445 [Trebonia sp.]
MGAHAPGLKTVEDAWEIRRRILTAFEAAEAETRPGSRRAWLPDRPGRSPAAATAAIFFHSADQQALATALRRLSR